MLRMCFYRLILGNYLAQQRVMAKAKLKGCFLISVPWNVFAATKNTEENYFNLMINKYLAGTLRKNIQRLHYSSEPGMFDVDIDTLLKVSLFEFSLFSLNNRTKKYLCICLIIRILSFV